MSDLQHHTLPSVSVAIPALNEENHIREVLSVFSTSSYPNIIEIFVADGGSTDATREIVNELSINDSRIQLIHNPDKIQAAGLNKLIKLAKGDLFIRADAHCTYSPDYVDKSVRGFLKSGALNVGGAQRFAATNNVQTFISFAVESFLGSGGASYRDINFEGYADTVFLGCYKTNVLKKIGGFIANSVTNEDAELNIRLSKEKPGAIYISKDIKVWYYPRRSFKALFTQYFNYGIGRCNTFFIHSISPSLRGSIPFIFISLYLISVIYLIATNAYNTLILVSVILAIIVVLNVSYTVIRRFSHFKKEVWKGDIESRPGIISILGGTLSAILIMNMAHFLGFGRQLIRRIFSKR